MRDTTYLYRLNQLSWLVWIAGTILIVASWGSYVSPEVGWFGFFLSGASVVLNLLVTRTNLFRPPLSHESFKHPWANFLPDVSRIPSMMKLDGQSIVTNAQLAQQRPNPAQALQTINDSGRTEGILRHYISKLGNHSDLALSSVWLQIIHYKTSEQASASLTSGPEDLARYTQYAFVENPRAIGEAAEVLRFVTPHNGFPPRTTICYSVTFRRGQFVAVVGVSAVEDTWTDAQLETLAYSLAETIDGRIAASQSNHP